MRACCPIPVPIASRSWTLLRLPQRMLAPLGALLSLIILVTALTGAAGAAAAPAEQNREEAAARAAYLYSFLGYIEWPSRALPLTDSPLVFGVLNADGVA